LFLSRSSTPRKLSDFLPYHRTTFLSKVLREIFFADFLRWYGPRAPSDVARTSLLVITTHSASMLIGPRFPPFYPKIFDGFPSPLSRSYPLPFLSQPILAPDSLTLASTSTVPQMRPFALFVRYLDRDLRETERTLPFVVSHLLSI